MTNAVEFFCIDMDKATNQPANDEIDYVEDLLDQHAGISDLETILINAGIDISSYTDQLCEATANILCFDLFDLLNMNFLVTWRFLTDNTLCYITDNLLGLFGMDIAIDPDNRKPFSDYKYVAPFKWFMS
eukprot:TRINITY_DN5625_c0_g1_i5.p2 TRINITY_DN5625_c0_g1~~TRINITY_DN5625_c0_g1_i5.p2  ORF type:complete len:130 (+),score=22.01 TRINITY_DN5625_c0_g1_i5:110-499(+)